MSVNLSVSFMWKTLLERLLATRNMADALTYRLYRKAKPMGRLPLYVYVPARTPPPFPSTTTTITTPQSTRCIVKKWEGTLEPSSSMKVGCSVCLLMRWKEDGSEKWNKVKEHTEKEEKQSKHASSGGKRGKLSPLFWTSFEVQVRHLRKK